MNRDDLYHVARSKYLCVCCNLTKLFHTQFTEISDIQKIVIVAFLQKFGLMDELRRASGLLFDSCGISMECNSCFLSRKPH